MGQRGQAQTPGQGQYIVFAILGVVGVQSHRRECLLGPFRPLIVVNAEGQRGQSRTPGQGQDSGECRVLLSLFDENECVAAYSALRRGYSWRNSFHCLLCVASQLLMARLFPLPTLRCVAAAHGETLSTASSVCGVR